MGTFIAVMVGIVLCSGPCVLAYLLGRRVGFNEGLRAARFAQRGEIDWNFRNPDGGVM